MVLHQASGRWRLGLALALTTAVFWATLPIALKITLAQVDAWTITWLRFVAAALMLGGWTAARGGFGSFRGLPKSGWWLLVLASLMLTGNFVGYLIGLQHTTPANAQLLIQAKAVGLVVVWTAVVSLVGFYVVKAVMGLRVAEEHEREGLDITSHGERAYTG